MILKVFPAAGFADADLPAISKSTDDLEAQIPLLLPDSWHCFIFHQTERAQ